MFIKRIGIVFLGAMLFVASAAAAANSVLEGVVKDARGHPIPGADVQIETKNGGSMLMTVKTDQNGRYISKGLAPGIYRVTLIVNGTLKTSINNTTLEPDGSTQLNFDLTQARAVVTMKKGLHRVWIPAFTGSRLPGRWVEVEDGGAWAAEASANNIVRVSGEELQRTVHSLDIKRGQ
jgi:5-hydroxyisourate hydrolase-like protein (transthyretin family)